MFAVHMNKRSLLIVLLALTIVNVNASHFLEPGNYRRGILKNFTDGLQQTCNDLQNIIPLQIHCNPAPNNDGNGQGSGHGGKSNHIVHNNSFHEDD